MKKLILLSLVLCVALSGSAFALENSVTSIKNLAMFGSQTYVNNLVSANTAQALNPRGSVYFFSNDGNFNNGTALTTNYIWPAPTYTLATTDIKDGAIKVFVKTTAAATANVSITPAASSGFSKIVLISAGDTATIIKKNGVWQMLSKGEVHVTAAATATAVGTYNITMEFQDKNGVIYLIPAVAK